MYNTLISRKQRGCIIFLLDRSASMGSAWGQAGTLAQGATRAINEILTELCFRAQIEPGRPRDYFDIGIFGYGIRACDESEGVESAFSGELSGKALVTLPDLKENPIAIQEVPSADASAPPTRAPVWIRPMHGHQTPMCQAIAVAGNYVYDWAGEHQSSFPPVVINITDGFVTDSPYQGADLDQWAQRLTTIQTSDGAALLFNIFLSPVAAQPRLFPASPADLPDPGPALFRISSVLPKQLVVKAREEQRDVLDDARGLVFNADFRMLAKALRIGTGVRTER